MNKQKMKLLTDWLEKHASNGVCDACGKTNWGVGDALVKAPILGMVGPVLPMAYVHCVECGYLRFHDARLVPGLVDAAAMGPLPADMTI